MKKNDYTFNVDINTYSKKNSTIVRRQKTIKRLFDIFSNYIIDRTKIVNDYVYLLDFFALYNYLDFDDKKIFYEFQTQLIEILFRENVCLIVCTLIICEQIIIQNFTLDYIIVQKTKRAINDDVFIAMTQFFRFY